MKIKRTNRSQEAKKPAARVLSIAKRSSISLERLHFESVVREALQTPILPRCRTRVDADLSHLISLTKV